jgi:hypothetical protein
MTDLDLKLVQQSLLPGMPGDTRLIALDLLAEVRRLRAEKDRLRRELFRIANLCDEAGDTLDDATDIATEAIQ